MAGTLKFCKNLFTFGKIPFVAMMLHQKALMRVEGIAEEFITTQNLLECKQSALNEYQQIPRIDSEIYHHRIKFIVGHLDIEINPSNPTNN